MLEAGEKFMRQRGLEIDPGGGQGPTWTVELVGGLPN